MPLTSQLPKILDAGSPLFFLDAGSVCSFTLDAEWNGINSLHYIKQQLRLLSRRR